MPSPLGGINVSELLREDVPVSYKTIVDNLNNKDPCRVQLGLIALNNEAVREILVEHDTKQACEIVEALIRVSEHSAKRKMREHAAVLANLLLVKLEHNYDTNKKL